MDSLTSKHPRSGFSESDENDAELVSALKARGQDVKDDADDSKAGCTMDAAPSTN